MGMYRKAKPKQSAEKINLDLLFIVVPEVLGSVFFENRR